ncbi:hypothetical protein ACFJGV_17390 [Cnuibacter sp. UC19_7]|uniref:hypothetical protein n=1 Tax=Cnuibacter sp. UC19_7 TaxID=3350166 RepID=UPI003672370F
MNLLLRSALPVWAVTLLGAVVVLVLVPRQDHLVFMPIVLGAVLVVTFAVQLLIPVRRGFVDRVSASLGGAVVLLLLATAVALLLPPA